MDDIINIIKNGTPLIDLRAPVEFNKGAFPSSINIPILNDTQRAKVGIEYKKQGNAAAEKLGFNLLKNEQNERVIADFIAGMTDRYAINLHNIIK